MYELFTLLIENAIPLEFNNVEVLESVKKFENKELFQQIEKYLHNRLIVHHLKIADINNNLLKKGIFKIVFKAKAASIAKKISKNGREYPLISFVDDYQGRIDILFIPDDGKMVRFIEENYLNQSWVNVKVVLSGFGDGEMKLKILNCKCRAFII